jgi:glycosyltransferase involved in cell wall biosynthesis
VAGAAVLVEDGDAAALGNAVTEIMREPERWKRSGLARARQFSWEKTARATISAYEAVYAGR